MDTAGFVKSWPSQVEPRASAVTTRRGASRLGRRAALFAAAGLVLSAAAGCARPDVVLIGHMREGEFGKAREWLVPNLVQDPGQRQYTIDRMRLGIAELADGLPDSAEKTLNETYEILRVQGLNEDRTVESVVINEGVKRWKGEPFEQALMYCYIAVQKAMRGEWGNARAASQNALFLLKDFSKYDEERGTKRKLSSSRFAAAMLHQEVAEHTPSLSHELTFITDGKDTLLVVESKELPKNNANAEETERPAKERDSDVKHNPLTPSGQYRFGIKMSGSRTDQCVPTTEFFKDLHARCDVTLVGDDVIDDQEVWVIGATARQPEHPVAHQSLAAAAAAGGYGRSGRRKTPVQPPAPSVIYFFSKETGVLLQQITSLPDGQVLTSQTFANYQFDLELPEGTFDPPENVPIQDMRSTPGAQEFGNLLMPW